MKRRIIFLAVLFSLVLMAILFTSCAGSGDDDDSAAVDDSAADDTSPDDDSVTDDTDDDTADDTTADDDTEAPPPVTPQVLVDDFSSSEGIAFLPDGRLFIVGDASVHEVFADGTHTPIADFVHPVGMTGDGEGNLLVAEYGPTSCFDLTPSADDGSIVRLTPEGAKTVLGEGIVPDPNFITVLPGGDFLVSDDCEKNIYRGTAVEEIFSIVPYTDAVATPNGMVLSLDQSELYVCQTFTQGGSIVPDNRVWRIPLGDGFAPGAPELLAQLPGLAAPDGGVLDEKGRLYVAANFAGTIYRIDPATGAIDKVADGMFGVASLAFGRGGDFPETSLYATQLYGGKIFRLDLGVKGAPIP